MLHYDMRACKRGTSLNCQTVSTTRQGFHCQRMGILWMPEISAGIILVMMMKIPPPRVILNSDSIPSLETSSGTVWSIAMWCKSLNCSIPFCDLTGTFTLTVDMQGSIYLGFAFCAGVQNNNYSNNNVMMMINWWWWRWWRQRRLMMKTMTTTMMIDQ